MDKMDETEKVKSGWRRDFNVRPNNVICSVDASQEFIFQIESNQIN